MQIGHYWLELEPVPGADRKKAWTLYYLGVGDDPSQKEFIQSGDSEMWSHLSIAWEVAEKRCIELLQQDLFEVYGEPL